jgi:hypothetical protein
VDDDIEQLEKLIKIHAEKAGKPAQTWKELVDAGVLRGVPVDPAGFPYQLATDGRVFLSRASPITTSTLGKQK